MLRSRFILNSAPCLVAVALVVVTSGADWLQFRGTDQSAVAASGAPPTAFSKTENVAWTADLPGEGVSGPIVVDGRIVVTASSGPTQDRLHVLCFSAADGHKLWERQFWATGRTQCHPTSSVAANTPASDGKNIYAFFSSNDLVCLDLDGNLKWLRGLTHDYPRAANDVGLASSPVIVDGVVIVQVECQADSFAAGIDAETGENRWRIARPASANWASPTVWHAADGRDGVILISGKAIEILDPKTGKVLAKHESAAQTIPSSTVVNEVIYAPCAGLTALKSAGDGAKLEVLWESNKLGPGAASPVVHEGRVFVINRAGVLACGNAADGDVLWQLRLKGPFWATPVLAGGRLYFASESGAMQVVDITGAKGEIIAENDLGEPLLGTPAIVDGALYVRSDKHLWKIAAP